MSKPCGRDGSTPRPIRRRSISACRSPSIAACSKTTSPAAWRGPTRWSAPACSTRPTVARHPRRTAADSRARPHATRLGRRRRRGHPLLRGAPAGRAHRRRRPPAAHRPIAQRAGLGGLPALSAPPHPAAAGRLRAVVAAFADQAERAGDALMPVYTHMRRAMPVLVSHFLLSHAAALRRDHQRLGRGHGGSRRAAARLGRHGRHRLRDRHRRPGLGARLLARRRQQHGHVVGSRLRGELPARRVAGDGAPRRAGRGLHPMSRPRSSGSSSWPTARPPAAA